MTIEHVRADVRKNVHGRLIKRYGGVSGIRDVNGLESAVARPQHLAHDDGIVSIRHLAASLAWALLRNHPFADGNKRTAFAAITIFFERNGHRLNCSEVEETATILRATATEITEAEFTAWVERTVVPL